MKSSEAHRSHAALENGGDPPYSLIAESLPHMVFTATPDGRVDFRNRAILDYTGTSATDGWKWIDVVHPEDRDPALRLWRAALASGTTFEHETRLLRHDGAYRWHRCVARPLRNPQGQVVLWVGTATDIEDPHRQLESLAHSKESYARMALQTMRGLRENEDRFRQFMEHLPDIAWIKDAAFRLRWVNLRYLQVHSRRLEDVLGRDDFALWPAPVARRLRAEDEEVARGNSDLRSRRTVTLGDGSTREYLVLKFPVPSRGGTMGIAGIGINLAGQPRLPARPHGARVRLVPTMKASERREPGRLGRLSARECQVLQLIADGCTSVEAAERLGLSPKSVETYRSRILSKLGLRNLTALVKFAIRHGITAVD